MSKNNSASNAAVPQSSALVKQAAKAVAAELAGGKPRPTRSITLYKDRGRDE